MHTCEGFRIAPRGAQLQRVRRPVFSAQSTSGLFVKQRGLFHYWAAGFFGWLSTANKARVRSPISEAIAKKPIRIC